MWLRGGVVDGRRWIGVFAGAFLSERDEGVEWGCDGTAAAGVVVWLRNRAGFFGCLVIVAWDGAWDSPH